MRFYNLAIIVFSTVVLISCGGAEERKAVYLEKAKSSMATGDYDKARIELKNVLQIDPKESAAYYQLGKVYEQQKDYRKAFSNYSKAAELDPENLTYKARLGRLHLFLANDLEKTQEIIDTILAKDPSNPDGLLLKAALLSKSDKKQEALTIANGILSGDTGNVDAAVFVATLYGSDKRFEDAITILDTALLTNKTNNQLKNLLALMLINNKDFERAEVVFKKFQEENPDDSASFNRLASLYDASGDHDKALETLRASIENDPDDAARYLTLVKYVRKTGGEDAAIAELESAVKNNNSLAELRLALGELYFVSGDKESAIKVYKKAIEDFSEEKTGIESRIILASLYIKDKKLDKANELVESAFEISPNDPNINLLRAKLALHNKETEKAIISLRIVVKELPENIEAYILLASAYQLENNDEQVKQTLKTAHNNIKHNAAALLKLAQYYLPRDTDKAENVIDDLLRIDNDSYKGLSIKSAILNKKKKEDEAFLLAERLIELYDEKPNGYLQVVPYLIKQEKISEAINTLELGYLAVKDNRKILSLLTTLQISTKQYDVAEKRIKAELKTSPEDTELNLLLAKVYLASNKTEEAEKVLKQIIANNPDIEVSYLWLSQIYKHRNDAAAVKQILQQGKDNVKSSYKIPFRLAAAYESEKDHENAIAIYRDMYEIFPNNVIVMNNLAAMLTDHSDDAADLELAKTIADKLAESDQPAFLDTVGWVYYKLDDASKAIEYLKQVVEKAPKVNVFNYHLGMAYKKSGDVSNAKIYLEKSLADKKDFPGRDMAQSALKEIQN